MVRQDFSNLTAKILIASPFAMEGNVFHKSLIYVLRHSDEGSVGLIFNQPINHTPESIVLKTIKYQNKILNLDIDMHIGGPIEVEREFFLHTSEYNKNLLFNFAENDLAVSSNTQILQDIVDETGPKNSILIMGYTGWSAGQLELELENNLWVISEPSHDLIFSNQFEDNWSKAFTMLGISNTNFTDINFVSC